MVSFCFQSWILTEGFNAWGFIVKIMKRLLLAVFNGSSLCSANTKNPNVVLLLADDLGYGEPGCYGQEIIQTPRLDELARKGMRFEQFYAGSSVCSPSRCVLVAGKHAGNATIRGDKGVFRGALRCGRTNGHFVNCFKGRAI